MKQGAKQIHLCSGGKVFILVTEAVLGCSPKGRPEWMLWTNMIKSKSVPSKPTSE
jgi:hypothetical protein